MPVRVRMHACMCVSLCLRRRNLIDGENSLCVWWISCCIYVQIVCCTSIVYSHTFVLNTFSPVNLPTSHIHRHWIELHGHIRSVCEQLCVCVCVGERKLICAFTVKIGKYENETSHNRRVILAHIFPYTVRIVLYIATNFYWMPPLHRRKNENWIECRSHHTVICKT